MKLFIITKQYVSKEGEYKEMTYLSLELDNGKEIRIKPLYETDALILALHAEKKVVNNLC